MAKHILVCCAILISPCAFANQYEIDPAQTSVTFAVKLLDLLSTGGKFHNSRGSIIFDAQSQQGVVNVTTPLAGVTLDFQSMEKEVLGPDFFDAEKYPVLEFKSTLWRFDSAKLRTIEGELTLHGVSRAVTLAVSEAHCPELLADGTRRCRAEARVTVKRNDFGLKAWSDFLGDDVLIGISLVANEQREWPDAEKPATPLATVPTR